MEPVIIVLLIVVLNYYSWYRPLYVQTDEDCTPAEKARRDRRRRHILSALGPYLPRQAEGRPQPKAWRIEAERRERYRRNQLAIAEWALASEHELHTLEPEELQRLLDSRNVHSDEITQLLVELDDPIIRPQEIEVATGDGFTERDEIMHRILALRLRPLRELRAQQRQRLQTIGNYRPLPVRDLPEG